VIRGTRPSGRRKDSRWLLPDAWIRRLLYHLLQPALPDGTTGIPPSPSLRCSQVRSAAINPPQRGTALAKKGGVFFPGKFSCRGDFCVLGHPLIEESDRLGRRTRFFEDLMVFSWFRSTTFTILLSHVEDLRSSPLSGLMTFEILMTFDKRKSSRTSSAASLMRCSILMTFDILILRVA
jgi:hypothetical protein